ncbi:RimJ/RimL family protein N-acetyltransferase [Dokdonia sp. Hel_I_63]|uniref:GNAT family N-acetyltransferase n=1 Tax=unclassified Dokdonia TaxID=2615033 RepID=UPI00020A76E6|nr:MULTISPECIES: GNAT family N-acetyltransferase [unclassified Dokdonia]AEE19265.1 GCN5-related N-acetyltransferase [Dokdonia sp. 4H-3-7-5]TVZ21498.1 RimJ/RimL family protein N-acetyltransferase [Dokdonia sp. Hel_I_63]
MTYHIETEHLILREVRIEDTGNMYRLDSNPIVHEYLGKNPITCMGKARTSIDYIRMQYETYGIGRWAAIEKSSGDWIGWTGLKYNFEKEMNGHTNFYDIGYRFMPEYWCKGYATESSIAARDYFFEHFPNTKLCGMAELGNKASCRVLEKIGLEGKNNFIYEAQQVELAWFEKMP